MANKARLPFEFGFEGDGTSTSVSIDLTTGPVFFQAPTTDYPLLSTTLGTLTGATIDNADLQVFSGLTVSSSTYTAGVLTIHFTSAASADTTYVVAGVLEF